MSEHYGFVACDCFRRGRTTSPPSSPDEFTFDTYGHLMLKDGTRAEEFPDELRNWFNEGACPHDMMRIVDEIFLNYWPYHETLVARVCDSALPVLTTALSADHGVLVQPEDAIAAIAEMNRLPSDVLADKALEYDLGVLCRLLQASAATGNPVVRYYSGSSLGFD